MIVYVTGMKTMPKACADCTMECSRPTSCRDYTKILKPYLTKRHPDCPLKEVKEVVADDVSE